MCTICQLGRQAARVLSCLCLSRARVLAHLIFRLFKCEITSLDCCLDQLDSEIVGFAEKG